MNEEEVKRILKEIYEGLISIRFLPLNLYLYTANKLLSGVYQGYGYTLTELVEKGADTKLLQNLQTNIYHFSAAKTFQNVYDLQGMLFTDGFKTPFNVFEKQAAQIFDAYNKTWLKTEYNAAIMSANAASLWQDIEKNKDVLPLLKYQTVGDQRVRDDHKRLDGIVKPVNDPFWNYAYPPNAWNCRCTVIQLSREEAEVTNLTKDEKKLIKGEINEVFRNNPGKSEKIFADHHPYFDVEDRYLELKKNNFNLPMP